MKRIVRASIGLLITVIIVFLIERTMDSFDFFPEKKVENKEEDSSVRVDSVSISEQVNELLNPNDLLDIDEEKQVKVGKVNRNPTPVADREMVNFSFDAEVSSYEDEIEVTLEFEEADFYKSVLFLVIDGYDTKLDKTQKQFYLPRKGLNRLRLKNDFSEGTHLFRVGYFLKSEVRQRKFKFRHKEFNIKVQE